MVSYMDINVKSKFGLRGVTRRGSFFVLFTMVLLTSSLFIGVFALNAEGQTAITVGTETELKATINSTADNVPQVKSYSISESTTGDITLEANETPKNSWQNIKDWVVAIVVFIVLVIVGCIVVKVIQAYIDMKREDYKRERRRPDYWS